MVGRSVGIAVASGVGRSVSGAGAAGPPPVLNDFFGTKLQDGGGNWGTSTNRWMFSKFTMPRNGRILRQFILQLAGGTGVTPCKGAIYTDNANSVAGGTRIMVSSPGATIINPGAVSLRQVDYAGGVLPAGDYWVGVGTNDAGGVAEWGSALDLPGPTGFAVMFNGTFSYDTPPLTAPTLAGEPGPYANTLSTYVEYEYDG